MPTAAFPHHSRPQDAAAGIFALQQQQQQHQQQQRGGHPGGESAPAGPPCDSPDGPNAAAASYANIERRCFNRFEPAADALRARLGLPPLRWDAWWRLTCGYPPLDSSSEAGGKAPPRVVVANAFSSILVPAPPDAGPLVSHVGALLPSAGEEGDFSAVSAALLRYVEAGPPPVCVGFGSMTRSLTGIGGDGSAAAQLTRVVLRGLLLAGCRRAVVLGGAAGVCSDALLPPEKGGGGGADDGGASDDDDDADLVRFARECLFEAPSAPHRWLLRRCCASVSHAGVGTLTAALRCVPAGR